MIAAKAFKLLKEKFPPTKSPIFHSLLATSKKAVVPYFPPLSLGEKLKEKEVKGKTEGFPLKIKEKEEKVTKISAPIKAVSERPSIATKLENLKPKKEAVEKPVAIKPIIKKEETSLPKVISKPVIEEKKEPSKDILAPFRLPMIHIQNKNNTPSEEWTADMIHKVSSHILKNIHTYFDKEEKQKQTSIKIEINV